VVTKLTNGRMGQWDIFEKIIPMCSYHSFHSGYQAIPTINYRGQDNGKIQLDKLLTPRFEQPPLFSAHIY
jgi:hypothetical protein